MKTTTRIFLSLVFCLSVSTIYGQDVFYSSGVDFGEGQDISKLPKMDRDIYILQNILNDLFTGDRNSYRLSRKSKGIYIPNNGVIFSISGNGMFGGSNYTTWDDLVLVVDQDANGKIKEYSEEELANLNKEKEEKIKKLSATFLTNYASLLGELKGDEKVQISVNYSLHVRSTSRRLQGQLAFVNSNKDDNKRRLVSSISVKDVKAFESGSMSLSQLESKITHKVQDINADDMVDAKIMAGIFDDLFRRTYDGYLSRSGRTSWTYFEGFGLMYNVNLSSRSSGFSISETKEGTMVVGRDDKQLKADDFYKKIQDEYAAFEKSVKENIVKYGRTLRSLSNNEVVIVNVNVSANKRSKLPKTIQFMISKSDIEAFAKGQKSMNQVMEAINIKKLSASNTPVSLGGHVHDMMPEISVVESVDALPARVVRGVKSN